MEKQNSPESIQLMEFLNSISKSQKSSASYKSTANRDDLQKKEEKLLSIQNQLKKEFVGLDEHINRIVGLIRPWYLIPSAIRKPVVIGLWGMTGVGKTSLVNRLVHHLEFEENFYMEDLGKYTGSDAALQSRIHYNGLHRLTGHPSIILLDEIHNVRTVDAHGMEIDRSALRDFWQLLDTGLISREMERYQELIMICETELSAAPYGDDPEKYQNERWQGFYNTYTLDRIITQLELPVTNARLQKMVAADFRGFTNWVISECRWFCKHAKSMDFTKSVIFVAGNLDEVFSDSNKLNPEDLMANELHEKTSQIGIDKLKECLLKRFKPEQVARMGGSLLVLPSLSRSSFTKLVDLNLENLVRYYKQNFDFTMTFEASVTDLVFRQGTIAAQGARILLSTIGDLIESRLPSWLILGMQNNCKSITVSFSNESKSFVVKNPSSKKTLLTEQVPLKEDRLPPIRLSLAHRNAVTAHEAGHAVVGIVCLGMLPTKVIAGVNSWHLGGPRVVFPPFDLRTKELMYQLIHFNFGGMAAEELVFGENNVSDGSSMDLYNATAIANQMISLFGMGEHLGISMPDPSAPFSLVSFKGEDDKTSEKILKDAYKQTKAILKEQWSLFKAISEKLPTQNKLTVLDFAELVVEHYKGSTEEIEMILTRKVPKALDSFEKPIKLKKTAA